MTVSPFKYVLCEGDYATATNLIDLNDGVAFGVHLGGFTAPRAKRGELRPVTLDFAAYGPDNDTILDNFAAIEIMLAQAALAAGPSGVGTPITLAVQIDATTMVAFDLWGGELEYDAGALQYIQSHWVQHATLTLQCEPLARGAQVTATNLLLNSAAFSAASWTTSNGTTTDNAAVAPNGATRAATYYESSATGEHKITQALTKAASALPYMLSWYVKPLGRNTVTLVVADGGGANGVYAQFDLAAGTVLVSAAAFGSGFTAGACGIRLDRQGYYRINLGLTSSTVTTLQAELQGLNGGSSYAGDVSKGFAHWGAALQPAATLGPYLETGASLTLVNGKSSTAYLYDVPGTAEALANLTLADTSTGGKAINAVHLYRRGLVGLTPADYTGRLALTASSGASATTDSSDYTGATFARLVASGSFQEMAHVLSPAGARGWSGRVDVIARVRDSTLTPAMPSLGAFSGIPPTVVQSVYSPITAGASVSLSWPNPTTTGNLLLIHATCCGKNTSTGWALATPSGWTLVASEGATGQANMTAVFKIENAASRSGAETVNATGVYASTGDWIIGLIEVEAVAATAVAASNGALNVGGSTISCGAITYSSPYKAKMSFIGTTAIVTGGEAGDSLIYAGGTSGTAYAASQIGATGNTTGSINPTFTTNGANVQWGALHLEISSGRFPLTSAYVAITTIDSVGHESAATAPTFMTTTYLAMQATATPANANWDHFRVYYRGTGSGVWSYYDLPSASTAILLDGQSTSGTTSLLPSTASSTPALFRMRVGAGSGAVTVDGAAVSAVLSNGLWEDLYCGTTIVPPVATRDGATAGQFWLAIDGMMPDGSPSNLDVDCVYAIPHEEPQCLALYQQGGVAAGLTTPLNWEFDSNRWGISSSVRLTDGAGNPAGMVLPSGPFYLPARECVLGLRLLAADRVSNVAALQGTLGLKVTPRYATLAGSR